MTDRKEWQNTLQVRCPSMKKMEATHKEDLYKFSS